MQNNNYIQSPLAQAYRQVYSQPVINPVASQSVQQPIQQQLTPEQINYIRSWANQPIENPQAEQLEGNWRGRTVNIQNHPIISDLLTIGRNIPQDLTQIGTGLVSTAADIAQNPIGSLKSGAKSIRDYINNLSQRANTESVTGNKTLDNILSAGGNAGYKMAQLAAKDIYNNFGAGYLPVLNTKNVGSIIDDLSKGKGKEAYKKLKETGAQSWEQFKQDPLITSLIVAPNTTVGGIGKVTKGGLNLVEKTTGLPVGKVGQNVAKAIQVVESKFNKDRVELNKTANELSKANTKDLELVIQNYTEGTPLPENLNELSKKFKNFQNEYRKLYDDNALVNPNELAALQYVQRKTGQTMQEIRRELAPQLEMLQEGVTNPSLLFRNRLDDFNHSVNSIRKSTKNNEFLNDSKPISELSREEFESVAKHFNQDELRAFYDNGASIKEMKQYLGDLSRDAWVPEKVSDAALKDSIFNDNLGKLATLAEQTGNPLYKHLYDGLKLANEGKIGAYTLAGADIPKGVSVSDEGRRFAGKSSSREYGTATYPAIAQAYRDIHGFLDDVTAQRVKSEISNNILNTGTIDGATKVVGDGVKPSDIRYVNPDLLAEGKLGEAITRASSTPKEGAIAVDKYNIRAINDMLKPTGTPYKQGILGDVYNLFKEQALASGIYLGGNLASGAFGTLLNSNTGLLKDIIASIGSKGRLSKELGTFRQIRPSDRRYSTTAGKTISQVGRKLGTGIAPRIDAMMQNTFAEINANAALRKMGIEPTQRVSALASMQKQKLANLIEDVRLNSMMNNKYRVIPRGEFRDILGIANPFIDWIDTSTQVSAKMLKDHPVLMGAVASKLFGEIGYDKELQKRLGLNVYTDKPLVTYKGDDKTGDRKEISINFLPQLTPLEFVNNPSKLLTGTSGAPVLGALYEASKGKNAYGNPMRRTHTNDTIQTIQGDNRYRVNPDTQMVERIVGTQGDEMLSTAIKNLFAPVSLFNKTVAPVGVGLYNMVSGDDAKYYMPYGQSIFGNINTGQPEMGGRILSPTTFSTGDPRNARTVNDIIKGLGTYYEKDYYPENALTGNQIRRIIRSGVRQNLKDLGE
jgi:hypothetical protein